MTITLSPEQKSRLIVLLNMELRDYNRSMAEGYARELNGIYIQLTGQGHENWKHLKN